MAKKMNKTWAMLKDRTAKGIHYITHLYYREVNGKKVPNYKTIGITAAVLAAAAGGYYLYRRHKKHGVVLVTAKKKA